MCQTPPSPSQRKLGKHWFRYSYGTKLNIPILPIGILDFCKHKLSASPMVPIRVCQKNFFLEFPSNQWHSHSFLNQFVKKKIWTPPTMENIVGGVQQIFWDKLVSKRNGNLIDRWETPEEVFLTHPSTHVCLTCEWICWWQMHTSILGFK